MIPIETNGSGRPPPPPPSKLRSPSGETVHPRDGARFVVRIPSELRMIEATVGYLVDRCRRHAFSGPRLSLNFRVGITEAIANAVLYGNGSDPRKYVRVEVHIDDVRVACLVEDQGGGFDPGMVPDPTLPENLDRSGGRGIFLIRKLMDDVQFSDRGNAIRLILLRDPPRGRQARDA